VTPEELLHQGDPEAAMAALQERARAKPNDVRTRVFLFQLLCVLGQWDRAKNQLKVLAELDAAQLAMVDLYAPALSCEQLREEVFAGKRTPLILGEPLPWLALLIEALAMESRGAYAEAVQTRSVALEQAVAIAGNIDSTAFEWIADADPRLGPVCEVIVDGQYYWLPFERIQLLLIDKPQDLRDVVWMPAQLRLVNGAELVALIPARYPGSETSADGAIRLARKTVWSEAHPECYFGHGQRLFATDQGEYPLVGTARIELNHASRA
jgi:type VI secretion system protein ImpE